MNKFSKIAFMLPSVALLIMAWNKLGEKLFEQFHILLLTIFICLGISILWLSVSFFILSMARNLTWHYFGYKKTFYLFFPFVFSKENGCHLLSNTLTYYSLLFDGLPEDFILDQANDYKAERNRMCFICERNGFIAYSLINIMLVGVLIKSPSWLLVILAVWIQTIVMYLLDMPEFKGIYIKYLDYKTDNVIFYLAKAAAHQGKLEGQCRTVLLSQAEKCGDYKRFEFYIYKSLKIQCMYLALSGGVDEELFYYLERKKVVPELAVIKNVTGQERMECLKVLADSAVLNHNREQKEILHKNFTEFDFEIQKNVGITVFDIWRNMLRDEPVEGEINHKMDQTRQILSDIDIYNKKIYKEYDRKWRELHTRLEKIVCRVK